MYKTKNGKRIKRMTKKEKEKIKKIVFAELEGVDKVLVYWKETCDSWAWATEGAYLGDDYLEDGVAKGVKWVEAWRAKCATDIFVDGVEDNRRNHGYIVMIKKERKDFIFIELVAHFWNVKEKWFFTDILRILVPAYTCPKVGNGKRKRR